MSFLNRKDSLNISSGSQCDLTNVSVNGEVTVEEAAGKNKKLIKIFEKFDLDNNKKLNTIELAKAMDYFRSWDNETVGDGNGLLSDTELDNGLLAFNKTLDETGDCSLKRNDVKKFIENITKANIENGGQVSIDDLLSFSADFDIQNVVNAQVITENGETKYEFTMKDGSVILLNQDKSYTLEQIDSNKTKIKSEYNSSGLLTNQIENYINGDIVKTEYEISDNESQPVKTNILWANGTKGDIIYSANGTKEILTISKIENGKEVLSQYYFDESNQPYITQKFINPNSKDAQIYNYARRYDEYKDEQGNTISIDTNLMNVTCYEPSCQTTTISSVIPETNEIIEEIIKRPGYYSRTLNFFDGGSAEHIKKDGKEYLTLYNPDGRRLEAYYQSNDKRRAIEYDGNGHTYIVVQNNESISKLAKTFGMTPDEIIALNEDKIISIDGQKGFKVGEKILVNGEILPDDAILDGRGSQEAAEATFARNKFASQEAIDRLANSTVRDYTNDKHSTFYALAKALYIEEGVFSPLEEQLFARVCELKKLNPDIDEVNLKGKTVKVLYSPQKDAQISADIINAHNKTVATKKAKEDEEGLRLAKALKDYVDDNFNAFTDAEYDSLLSQINKDNVVSFIEQFNAISPDKNFFSYLRHEQFFDTYGAYAKKSYAHVISCLKERMKPLGINIYNLDNRLQVNVNNANSRELHYLSSQICREVRILESVCPEQRAIAKKENINIHNPVIEAGNIIKDASEVNFNHQLEQDGIYALIWEGLKAHYDPTNPNIEEKVDSKLKEFSKNISELEKAYKAGGDDAFKAKFKELFMVEFKPELAEAYVIKKYNYAKATWIDERVKDLKHEYMQKRDSQCIKRTKIDALKLPEPDNFNNKQIHQRLGVISNNTNTENPQSSNKTISAEHEYVAKMHTIAEYLKLVNSDFSDEQALEEVKNMLKGDLEAQGKTYKDGFTDEQNELIKTYFDSIFESLNEQIQYYSAGKTQEEMQDDLTNSARCLFGEYNDTMNDVYEYMHSQTNGAEYVETGVKVLLAASAGFAGGGFLATFKWTTALTSVADITDECIKKDFNFDRLMSNLGEDVVLGLVSGVGSSVRNGLKAFYKGIEPNKLVALRKNGTRLQKLAAETPRELFLATGDSSVAAGYSLVSTGNIDPTTVCIGFTFSFVASFASQKIITKPKNIKQNKTDAEIKEIEKKISNRQRVVRRNIKGVDKERKVLQKFFDIDKQGGNYAISATLILENIFKEDNLGNLHILKQSLFTMDIPEEDIQQILQAIAERENFLRQNHTYTTDTAIFIDEDTRNRAISALNSPNPHLLPEQYEDIAKYLESISDKSSLLSAINKLKNHGIDLTADSDIKYILDYKIAEFNLQPTVLE